MLSRNLKFSTLLAGTALAIGFAGFAGPTQADEYTYYGYDTDNDGYLNEVEYVEYSYNLIDYDDDGDITEDEWSYYTDVWYEPYDNISYNTTYDFDYYDTDGDGIIEMMEYEAAYDEDLYYSWDTDNDGYVEVTEYNNTVDMYADYDDDGLYEW